MSNVQCQHCGSTEIDTDPSRGDSVCTQCGSVLEDAGIVSEVQFAADSRGVKRVVGSLVNCDEGMHHGPLFSAHYGLGRESRAVTLRNAKHKIQQLASQLHLNNHNIDLAFNFYKMALGKNLTKGRKSPHVIAACVYMVCRKEETPHMLLDLSDILQISVYELGKTYLRLSSAMHIASPAIDPSLYILRFAHQLDFGKKTHEVATTASRLVQRMKKDWMHTGRRPSGLCGAALLVAARMHEFNRSVDDVIKVVKVCQATVRKRLSEFSETPSSRLTLDEFLNIDLEEEQDPPCFKNARKKLQQDLEDDNRMKEIKNEVNELQRLIEKALEGTKKRNKYSKLTSLIGSSNDEESLPSSTSNDTIEEVDLLIAENTAVSLQPLIESDVTSDSGISELAPLLVQESGSVVEGANISELSTPKGHGPGPTAESIGLKESIEDCLRIPEPTSEVVDDRLDVTGLDDDELDNYLLDPNEYQKKDFLWHKFNAEYLQELKEKEERRAREEEENANKPEKKRKRRFKRSSRIQAATAGEAMEKMMQQKKLSFKLDYEVLKTLNPGDTPSETTVTKSEHLIEDEISPILMRNTKARFKPKAPAPVPLNIKRGMSDIIVNKRKKDMLAALASEATTDESPPGKISKVQGDELAGNKEPLETITLDEANDEASIEPAEDYIIDDDDEEEDSDDEQYLRSGLLQAPKEEKVPDYYGYDDYVDDFDD